MQKSVRVSFGSADFLGVGLALEGGKITIHEDG